MRMYFLFEGACAYFGETRPFSRFCAFFLFMKDALFIVPHDIYIGRTLYEVRLSALRCEEKNSVETPNDWPCSLTQIGNLSLYRFCLSVEHLAHLVLEGMAGNVKRIRKARCSTDKRRVNKKQRKQLKNV